MASSIQERSGTRPAPGVPTIVTGPDAHAIADAMLPVLSEAAFPFREGPPDMGTYPLALDHDEIERRLAALPDQPRERLR